MRRRLPACLLVAVALAGPGGATAAEEKPVERPPTALWNAFPLREQPEPAAGSGVAAAEATRLAPVPGPGTVPLAGAAAGASDPAERLTTILLLVEIALMLGAIGLAIVFFAPDLNRLAFARGRPHLARTRRPARRAAPAPTTVEVAPPLMPRLPAREPQPRAPAPAVASADERCRVYWRRGYVSAEFVAKASPDASAVVAVSPAFRWRQGSPPDESEASARALADLVDRLERDGWVAAGSKGREWFELAFVWPRAAADACRVEWSHAYVTGYFRAVVAGPDGRRTVIAESPNLRSLRGRAPADSEQARAALDDLVGKLGRSGWAAEGRGEEWFSLSLRRR
jgi:hypothetical protein